jgi:electron transport complex protein RnfC
MKLKTFRGGVHPLSSKRLTKEKPVEKAPLPGIAVIPLSQHIGAPAKPVVEAKAQVKVGTKIGELQGRVSANVHSSISGVVKSIGLKTHPVGGNVLSIVVESDQEDQKEEYVQAPDVDSLASAEIVDRVQQAGIVGLGGAAFPTQVKLCPPKDKPVDIVILNGAECEPYLTSDYRLLIERPEDILYGGKLVMKALGAQKGYIAIEDNKPEAIPKFESLAGEFGFELCVLKTKYPQGGERQLIHAISGREVPCGGLPFEVGVCVSNIGTAVAIYEACTTGKPLIERVVTVTGAVKEPKNVLARIGTTFKDLIECCGGYLGEPEKILMGGPMMGIAQITDDVPVIKATSGILVQAVASNPLDEPCIRCGSCIEACGMGLLPARLGDCIESGRFEEAKELGLLDCIECGSCAWICPSRRNLVHLYKYGKSKLQKMK